MNVREINSNLRRIGLTDDEIFVLKMTLFPRLPKTHIEIGRVIGMKETAARKIELDAISKLGVVLAAEMGVGE